MYILNTHSNLAGNQFSLINIILKIKFKKIKTKLPSITRLSPQTVYLESQSTASWSKVLIYKTQKKTKTSWDQLQKQDFSYQDQDMHPKPMFLVILPLMHIKYQPYKFQQQK